MKEPIISGTHIPMKLSIDEIFRREMRELVPEAVGEIRRLLTSPGTSAFVKKMVVDLVLEYGLEEAVSLRGRGS